MAHYFDVISCGIKQMHAQFSLLFGLHTRRGKGGGVCRWDPRTLSLYQSSFKWILLPYIRLNSQNPALWQSSCFPETTEVTNTVQPKQNRFDFFMFLSGNSRFSKSRLRSSSNRSVSWKMIPYSSLNFLIYIPYPRVNCLKTITLHSGTYCKTRQDKTRQCFIWSLIQSYVHRLYPNNLKS